MAFINPYQTAQSQLGLTEALLGGEQKKKAMQAATAGQMGKMEKEFQQKVLAAQKAAEAQLRKKKKGGWLGKLASFASGFAGPIAGPILSGLISGVQMKGQSDFAKKQASRAKAAALGIDMDRYGGTFLGKKARAYEAESESMYDKMISEADVGFGDIFKTALQSGITSMATGKAMGKATESIKAAKAAKSLEKAAGGKEALSKIMGKADPSKGLVGMGPTGQPHVPGSTVGIKADLLKPGISQTTMASTVDPLAQVSRDVAGQSIASPNLIANKLGAIKEHVPGSTLGVKSLAGGPTDLIAGLKGGQQTMLQQLADLGISEEQIAQYQQQDGGFFKQLFGDKGAFQEPMGLEEGQEGPMNIIQRLLLTGL